MDSANFYHRTHNLAKALSDGRLKSLAHLARDNPSILVSVEPSKWTRDREKSKAKDALQSMESEKDVNHIFLTKDKPLRSDTYGKYIIEKKLKSPVLSDKLNFIPSEYKQKKFLSLKSNASIYVPKDELPKFKKKYKGYNFKPTDNLKDNFHPDYSLSSYVGKVLDKLNLVKTSDLRAVKPQDIHPAAMLTGSRALGINLDNSDVDLMVYLQNKKEIDTLAKKLQSKYNLTPSPYNHPKRNKTVLISRYGDVVLTSDPKAQNYLDSLKKAKQQLTKTDKQSYINQKKQALNSWFFPQTKYKKLKRQIDRDLGIQKM